VNRTSHESEVATPIPESAASGLEAPLALALVAGAEPPPEQQAPEQGHRHESAAGLYSIYETMRRGVTERGVTGSLRTLLRTATCRALPARALLDPARQRRGLLPGGQRARTPR
jgi:hypothetical protein